MAGVAGIVLGEVLGILITSALIPPALDRPPAAVVPPAEATSHAWLRQHVQREDGAVPMIELDKQSLMHEHLLRENGAL